MPTHTTYTPQPGSGAARVLQWFLVNREEHLTNGDVASKFEIPRGSVPGILERAVGVGMLRIVRDTDGSAYAAGPNLDQAAESVYPPPSDPAQKGKPTRKGPGGWPARRLPELDLSSVQIRANTPVPPKHLNRAGEGRYTPLLDELIAPGMSFELPKSYRASMVKSVATYSKHHNGKRKFLVRTLDSETCGVWRTE
jgi:hypothetical protein